MNKEQKNVLAYTNPLGWVVAIGMGVAALLNGIFGNVVKRTSKSFKDVYKQSEE